MYEDRDYNTIMSEMMDGFGADVRTDEGSLAYNSCAKIAQAIEETYEDMDELADNMLPDKQDISHLIRYAQERGIAYKYATKCVVRASFSQEIAIGERFTCNDYVYSVLEKVENYTYRLLCETEGAEPNGNVGDLEPIDYVDDYQGGKITEVVVPGVDDEDTEVFRARVIESFQTAAFGGNKADYRKYIDGLQNVGGCKPMRRKDNSSEIDIWLLGADYNVPSSEVVSQVQDTVDPVATSGEGDGMAPICHQVVIKAVEQIPIIITAKVTFDTGYNLENCKELFEQTVQTYLAELRANWEKSELKSNYVRVSMIASRLLDTKRIVDISDVQLNGEAKNVEVPYNAICTFNRLVVSEVV